jgi:glycine/serine hydroxymethyltransferase
MGEEEMRAIAGMIDRVLRDPASPGIRAQVKADVEALCLRFPLYPELRP